MKRYQSIDDIIKDFGSDIDSLYASYIDFVGNVADKNELLQFANVMDKMNSDTLNAIKKLILMGVIYGANLILDEFDKRYGKNILN